jgi:hypothetical protein
MPLPPQKTEKSRHVLQLHHLEHLDWLHHHLVWQLLGNRPQGATEGSV